MQSGMLDEDEEVFVKTFLIFEMELMKANFWHSLTPHTAPAAPIIIPNKCSAENNSVTVAWQQVNSSFIQGYVLELDDGNGGEFRVSLDLS